MDEKGSMYFPYHKKTGGMDVKGKKCDTLSYNDLGASSTTYMSNFTVWSSPSI